MSGFVAVRTGSRALATFSRGLMGMLALLTGVAGAEDVLIFGGTGQLGAPHVAGLIDQGKTVAVFHRQTSSFERLEKLQYRKVQGDLLDAESVMAAMHQVQPRVVIDTTSRRGNRLDDDQNFYALAAKNLVDAAAQTRVEQIIIHSSIGVRDSANYVKQHLNYNPDNPNMRDKAKAEVVIEESGISYTIIRNGLLVAEPAPATGGGHLIENQQTFGRITRSDLARLALECVDNTACFDKIYHAIDESLR